MTCERCGKPCKTQQRRGLLAGRWYCSKSCRVTLWRQEKGAAYRVHSSKLARAANRRRRFRPPNLSVKNPCGSCGCDVSEFFINGNPKKFCAGCHSSVCRCGALKEYGARSCVTCSRSARPRGRRENWTNSPVKRAERFGVSYEPIQRARVMERDGWTCRICCEPIDRKSKHPHPLSPSLDHVIPMSAGGPHTYANVQAAHLRCNVLKRDRLPETMETA